MIIQEKYNLQLKFCKENKFPMFAPKLCFRCKRSVFERYDEEYCKTRLIIGCPHCNYSFVD